MQMILLSNIGIGNVDPELDSLLLHNYLQAFISSTISLQAICLYSSAVKLACSNSSCLAQLQILEQQGATIFVCTTCLHYFELQNQLQIGELTTMPDIINMQLQATKILQM